MMVMYLEVPYEALPMGRSSDLLGMGAHRSRSGRFEQASVATNDGACLFHRFPRAYGINEANPIVGSRRTQAGDHLARYIDALNVAFTRQPGDSHGRLLLPLHTQLNTISAHEPFSQ